MWTRPTATPKVWSVIDIVDVTGKIRKFSLQEIPEKRYDEALQHMCNFFLRDETICASLNMADDPAAGEACKKVWRAVLKQGISIGAFEVLNNTDEPVMAGVSMLMYVDSECDKIWSEMEFNSPEAEKFITFSLESCAKVDPRKLYGVDRYLGAFGLSVDQRYRGLKLGHRLLKLRDDVGKTYGLQYTSTIFSNKFSWSPAESVGFQTNLEGLFDEAVDADGNLFFPKLKGLPYRVMGKRLF